MFVPLHTKSDYSIGCGTASVEELVVRAASSGFTALALTDLENLCGQVDFHRQCRARGLHPVTGVELRPGFDGRRRIGSPAGRLVLLAENQEGYQNLCRIISRRREAAGSRHAVGRLGRDPLPLVIANNSGLIAMSDDVAVLERLIASGLMDRRKIKLLVVRPERSAASRHPRTVAQRLGINMVADIDAVFLDEADHSLHLLQFAIKTRCTVQHATDDPAAEDGRRRLRTPDEAAALFADLPEAVDESHAVAENCRICLGSGMVPALGRAAGVRPRSGQPRTPSTGVGSRAVQALRVRCDRALGARRISGRLWTAEHDCRLARELALVKRLGLCECFLMIDEVLRFCRNRSIPVVPGGSTASSLILHLLGGCPVDPLAQGLLFETFVNEEKTSWPEMDLDIPAHRRDEVIGWMNIRFGRDNVAMLAEHHRFGYRSALRAGLEALGASALQVDVMSRLLPPEEDDARDSRWDDPTPLRPDCDAWLEGFGAELPPSLTRSLALLRRLVGRPQHPAVHPGGILIGGGPLEDVLPLERASKGVVMIQYDMPAAADLGFLTINLRGNHCLSQLDETLQLAGRPERLSAISDEDPSALALIDRVDTLGCFKLENPAMRSLLSRLPINRRSDIVAALALVRPGRAAGAARDGFVARARGETPAELFDPVMADRIAETHGILLYEEDIMVLLSRIGGLSLGEADRLRSDIVHSGGDPTILDGLEAAFQKKAGSTPNHHAAARARRAFAGAVRFSAHAFNKAHAAGYAHMAYLSAYMKAHYPTAFACALINNYHGVYPLRTLAAELIRSGIGLRPPHVNSSVYRSSIEKRSERSTEEVVRVGLDKIRFLSQRCAEKLIATRMQRGPFISLGDLFERVRPTIRQLRAMVLAGACDGLPPLGADQYPLAHETVLESLQLDKQQPGAVRRMMLADMPSHRADSDFKLFQRLVRARNELRYLDMHLTVHPVALLRHQADRFGCVPISKAIASEAPSRQHLFALVAAMRRVPERQGSIQCLTLEDETGLLQAVAPYSQDNGLRITSPGPYLIEGTLHRRQGEVYFEISGLNFFSRYGRA